MADKTANPKIRKDLEAGIAAHCGQPLKFSLGILNGKGWQFFNEKRFEDAVQPWNLMLDAYPSFSEGYWHH